MLKGKGIYGFLPSTSPPIQLFHLLPKVCRSLVIIKSDYPQPPSSRQHTQHLPSSLTTPPSSGKAEGRSMTCPPPASQGPGEGWMPPHSVPTSCPWLGRNPSSCSAESNCTHGFRFLRVCRGWESPLKMTSRHAHTSTMCSKETSRLLQV